MQRIFSLRKKSYSSYAFILWIICLFVIMINLVFFYTYPINTASSDNPNYLVMMHDKASNLIHASGYPWCMIILLKLFHISPSATVYDLSWLSYVQKIQFFLHINLFILCVFLCAKVFHQFSGVILCLFWGLNTFFMGGANAASPEWLQAEWMILLY